MCKKYWTNIVQYQWPPVNISWTLLNGPASPLQHTVGLVNVISQDTQINFKHEINQDGYICTQKDKNDFEIAFYSCHGQKR